MIIMAVNTACFDVLMALSPSQKWSAMRQFNVDISTQRAVVIICLAAILILSVSFYHITRKKAKSGNKVSDRLFNDYVKSCGLSEYQSHLLSELGRYMNLEKKELLFTLADVFDRGLQAFTTSKWFMSKDQQNKQHLIEELTVLREKIGFDSDSKFLNKTQKIEIGELPLGQELFLSHSRTSKSSIIKAEIVKNESNVLTVKTDEAAVVFTGQNWYVRFSFIECVWEFNVTVLSCFDNILVLSHDNNVRFASRRHFHTVETDLPGVIAKFSFSKEIKLIDEDVVDKRVEEPEFVDFKVKKITGPYLAIETGLEISGGDRVIVIFEQAGAKKILQSTATVKNVKENEGLFNGLIELAILAKADMNELICMANAVDLKLEVGQEQKQAEFSFSVSDETTDEVTAGRED